MNADLTPAQALRLRQGARIRENRLHCKLSQEQLAAAVGVSKAAVSQWETGLTSPQEASRVIIAQTLGCPWHILFSPEGAAA